MKPWQWSLTISGTTIALGAYFVPMTLTAFLVTLGVIALHMTVWFFCFCLLGDFND